MAVDGAPDERQRVIEGPGELLRDDVVAQCGVGLLGRDAFGQTQDEIAAVHALRKADQVFDVCSHGICWFVRTGEAVAARLPDGCYISR